MPFNQKIPLLLFLARCYGFCSNAGCFPTNLTRPVLKGQCCPSIRMQSRCALAHTHTHTHRSSCSAGRFSERPLPPERQARCLEDPRARASRRRGRAWLARPAPPRPLPPAALVSRTDSTTDRKGATPCDIPFRFASAGEGRNPSS